MIFFTVRREKRRYKDVLIIKLSILNDITNRFQFVEFEYNNHRHIGRKVAILPTKAKIIYTPI